MLREEDGVFIAAAVFIATLKRGERWVWLVLCLSHCFTRQRDGMGGERQFWQERERVSDRRGKKGGKERGLFLSVYVCLRN